jgi:phosphoribosylaminoimidazole-succinocarboxamide synthase
LRHGKVRDVYADGDVQHLLIVASERISLFDHVRPNHMPSKGCILTQFSNFWFDKTRELVPNHLVDAEPSFRHWEDEGRWRKYQLLKCTVLVKKAGPMLIEAVASGYLVGSSWKEY